MQTNTINIIARAPILFFIIPTELNIICATASVPFPTIGTFEIIFFAILFFAKSVVGRIRL